MARTVPDFDVRLASSAADVRAAQALRYQVFVAELGGRGADVDHARGLERDRFDAHADHLLLCDRARPEGKQVVGVYRVLRAEAARAAGQFYSEDEYDLAALRRSGLRLMELGRSCLHPDYRGGAGLLHLWQGLADYIARHRVQLLFGVASFHGTDPQALAHPLSFLDQRHRAPDGLRPRSRRFQRMDILPPDQIDRRRAALEMPSLIKGYLRLGGGVGEGAFIDHDFNTTDVCLVLDTARLTGAARALVAREGA